MRRTFYVTMTSAAAVLTVVLLIGGALLFVGHTFASGTVTSQLSAQKIFFPPAGEATADPAIGPYINRYAGQQLTTGPQAKAYADHFIAVHLKGINDGKTYSETSTEARANPEDAALEGKVQSLFRGETLRGLLLTAYAFYTVGQIAFIGSIVAWVLGAIMLLVTVISVRHLRHVAPKQRAAEAVSNGTRIPVAA
jgi:hypothetical protein